MGVGCGVPVAGREGELAGARVPTNAGVEVDGGLDTLTSARHDHGTTSRRTEGVDAQVDTGGQVAVRLAGGGGDGLLGNSKDTEEDASGELHFEIVC